MGGLMTSNFEDSISSVNGRSLVAGAFVAAVIWSAGSVAAQQHPASGTAPDAVSPSAVTTAPTATTASRNAWLQKDLADFEDRSRRARNALIGTSAVFGVGTILGAIGASQCQWIQTFQQRQELLCNTTGDVLFPMGVTMAGLGAIGMITSGIILGVSNKRRRDIQRNLQSSSQSRRLQWDIPSGTLVF